MRAAFLEPKARGLQQVEGGCGDQNLSGVSQLTDARRGVHGQTSHITSNELDLAGVDRGPDGELKGLDGDADGCCAADGARGAVEHREESVPGRRDLASSISVELPAHDRVVAGQELAPLGVADPLGDARRPDDVGEQQGREQPVGCLDRWLRKRAHGACPIEDLRILVPHDPRVVAGRDVIDVRGSHLLRGAVVQLDADAPAHHWWSRHDEATARHSPALRSS